MQVVKHLQRKYKLDLNQKSPIDLPGGRRERGFGALLKELGVKVGAEIGVERGKYAQRLFKTIPGLKLYGIDAWTSYGNYRQRYNQEAQDKLYEHAKMRLAPYDCKLIRAYSMDAVKVFDDESLDFVFIDANHEFQHCTNDIAEWSKKVKKGGIVAGHDYAYAKVRGEKMHVKDVIDGWTHAYEINPWFVFRGDKGPSWLWVKK